MSNEQNNLRGIKPFCAFCYRKKEQVKVLATVHGKHLCNDCCDAIRSKMNEPVDTPPDDEPRRAA